jgi:hypothetical protein
MDKSCIFQLVLDSVLLESDQQLKWLSYMFFHMTNIIVPMYIQYLKVTVVLPSDPSVMRMCEHVTSTHISSPNWF